MKIIDLLNKIANGEIETFYKFIYRGKIVTMRFLIDNYLFLEILNDEIEILDDEEKGLPEKIPFIEIEGKYTSKVSNIELAHKINEIIDYLEKQRKGE